MVKYGYNNKKFEPLTSINRKDEDKENKKDTKKSSNFSHNYPCLCQTE